MVLCGMWCHQQDCIQWRIQGVFVGYGQTPLTCPGATGVAQTTLCVTAFINQISD